MIDTMPVPWFLRASRQRATPIESAREQLLVFTSLGVAAIALVWMLSTLAKLSATQPQLVPFFVATPFLFLAVPLAARASKLRLTHLIVAFIALLYALVTLVAALIGGAVSTTSFFLVLVPVLATLLLGQVPGVVWFVIAVATYAGLHMARDVLPAPAYALTAAEIGFWNALTLSLVAGALTGSVLLFRQALGRSNHLLVSAQTGVQEVQRQLSASEEVNRAKSEFMANMSHEFRTPLNAIIGYGEMLLESAEADGRGEDATDGRRVIEAAQRLRGMVDGMLRLASVDTAPLDYGACDLGELLGAAVEAKRHEIDANDNSVRIETDDVRDVVCDADKLAECLDHLLDNAAKFTHGGAITVRARLIDVAGAHALQVDVCDTGSGIAADRMQNLFKPFGLADSALDRAHQQGMGLGLALTKRLAETMGGDIKVFSEAAKGSTFVLTLPVPPTAS